MHVTRCSLSPFLLHFSGMCSLLAAGDATIRLLSRRQRTIHGISVPIFTSTRRYVNALYRAPPVQTVPTHNSGGEEVDTELFIRQFKELFYSLKQTQLVEQIHEMRTCPYYECLFTADLIFQHYDIVLPMPKYGREHRSSEISETLRYLRACGASGDFNHILQDVKGGAASGGDFVSTSHGILMAYGTARTNKLSMMALTGGGAADEAAALQQRALNVVPIEVSPDAPPLADLLAFAGKRTLIVQDTVHGRHAAEAAAISIPKIPWQILRVEPGCSFLSHLCGVNAVYDVLVDQDYPNSMERIGEAGLNPFPVEWTEPRKLGITMRSVCLIARFARGTMSAGGYADSDGHRAASFTYHSRGIAKNSRLFQNGHRRHGDNGAPLEAQLRSGELPEPVYQRPPRYAPPMHRRGGLMTSDAEGKE
ncbi:hypothetical protein C3747_59g6 [Trypanosoma cruzi]|uniref:RNA-editing substrate-binding complex 5 protein domain-containing protein n=2 Tax=Trypanosoma cruzi TaxID=5693 RepID=Q4DMM3_TRYCC|nr:hypothetical protein, conserved [Trypanosoma cruzi]EAN93775.1 hypothetical protein, conserved [Trypanosoma cruzi]PWV11413.1 hypothetical protein C3747_59g6 [Trypanosoma cruzi]|eukprot:XP_815626.1 hypothetical protein [Trypanosoma cruzi strain CL Brener]